MVGNTGYYATVVLCISTVFYLSYRQLAVLGISTVFYLIYRLIPGPRRKNLPPGPSSLSLLLSIPVLVTDTLNGIQGFARQYGDVIWCNAGSCRLVFLSSAEVIREAFIEKGRALSGRPGGFIVELLTDKKGIAMANGHVWKEQRKFTMSVLREFGVGKIKYEKKIQEATEPLVHFLQRQNGEMFDPADIVYHTLAHVIGNSVFGSTYDRNSEEALMYIRAMRETLESMQKARIVDICPLLQHLPGDLFDIKLTKKNLEIMFKYGRESVRWHRENPPESGEPRDFLDAYLQKMSELKDTDVNQNAADFSEDQLLQVVRDLFFAGIDTASSTLLWAFLYMSVHQDVQRRVQQELDEVFPGGQAPTLQKRANCV